MINTKVLSHIGTKKTDNKNKMFFIGLMTKKLLNVLLHKEDVADRDNFKNKRVETPGILMSQLFKKLYKNMLKALKLSILKETNKNLDVSINKFIKKAIIENGLKYSLATGNWNAKVGEDNGFALVTLILVAKRLGFSLSHDCSELVGECGELRVTVGCHRLGYGCKPPTARPGRRERPHGVATRRRARRHRQAGGRVTSGKFRRRLRRCLANRLARRRPQRHRRRGARRNRRGFRPFADKSARKRAQMIRIS